MDVHENWRDVKTLFRDSFKSSFHYAIATVTEDGEPHVTPIGSLILGKPGEGFYFEKFTQHLPRNIGKNSRVCVLAVNSSRWFWIKSLLGGKFSLPPAVRLHGTAQELRPATEREMARWQKRVSSVRFTKGHRLMWSEMSMVRVIRFDRIEPVRIGRMTQGLWQGVAEISRI
ncbi:MAG: pyridoxamine 5'-phosphate oxidase family protein [Gammaproteobacteria bacterium]|nr:pyridoxamine 5'-phosphate oxidase family protein [Gammaproteobacteria bacterium]